MATQIKFDERNYRKHSKKNKAIIKKSLSELGAGRSILLDNEDSLIAGNGVYEQAQALGIPVRVIETDGSELIAVKRTDLATGDEKRRKLALADNVASDLSEFDVPLLQTDWSIEALGEWGVELPEIEEAEPKDAQEDNFNPDEEKIETVCKEGDLWQLGNHRLMCGDSTKPEDVQRLMQGELADLWLTDPPYNVDYSAKVEMLNEYMKKIGEYKLGGVDKPIENDVMPSAKFFAFLVDAFSAAFGSMKKGCAFYVWFSSREHVNFETALGEVGLQVRQEIIWNKKEAVLSRQDYQWKHEPCLYGWKEGAAHYFVDLRNQRTVIEDEEEIDLNKMKKDELKDLCQRLLERPKEETVIMEGNLQRNHLHPTMKPVRLFGRLVRNSSRKGEIVLDTFGGSGSTLIACEQLNRKCFMMELDPHYCDVIIARWEKFTGQKAIKL